MSNNPLIKQQEELVNWLSPKKSGHSETTTTIGTALSESSNGLVSVELDAAVLSDDGDGYSTKTTTVNLPTTVYCKAGDKVLISMFGVNGVKTPTVTGVSGGGDRMQEAIEGGGGGADPNAVFHHQVYPGPGITSGTVSINVNLTDYAYVINFSTGGQVFDESLWSVQPVVCYGSMMLPAAHSTVYSSISLTVPMQTGYQSTAVETKLAIVKFTSSTFSIISQQYNVGQYGMDELSVNSIDGYYLGGDFQPING